MFSWHGQEKFETDQIDKLVTTGPVSSGTYSSFLSDIFLEGIAKVDYQGLRNQNGRQLAVFGYVVPIADSSFQTRTDSGTGPMGYHGQFTVDVSTRQLVSLQILTDDMPESAGVCSFSSEVRYSALTLTGIGFQLPASVDMDVLTVNREHNRTLTHYGECHEFRGESVLRFDGGGAAIPTTPLKRLRTVASGLQVQIRVTTSIDPRTAWAGDPIEGRLAADVVDEHGELVLPKGTLVQGRILRFESWVKPAHSYTVALQFERLNLAGGRLHSEVEINSGASVGWEHKRCGREDLFEQSTNLRRPGGGALPFRPAERQS